MTTNMTADEPNSSQKESSLPRTQEPMPEKQVAETDESSSPLRSPSTLATSPPVAAPVPVASSSVLSEGESSAVAPAAKASAADPKTPPPSPPPLLRRTTGHLPEKRMGSSSSNEYNPSTVSPVSPITSPDQTLKNSDLHALKGTPPATPERVRKPVNNNKSPKSPIINPRRGSASAPTTNPRRGSASASASASTSASTSNPHPKPKRQPTDLPIPISSTDPHHSHDLPIFSPPPAEEKISLHPTTRSHSIASISSLSSSLNERNEEDYSLGTATNVQSTSHSHKHPPKPSSSEAGYKGKLWSDWHWHRNLDLPVQPRNQPGVTEAELEKKKYVSPYPRPVSSGGGGNTARDWKKDLGQAAGWAKEKFGEFGKKLNENMHYGGDSGRGRRNREGNVSFK